MAAKIEVSQKSDGSVHARITGKIDEHFEPQPIYSAIASAQAVVLELEGVRSISSLGVRAFEAFLRGLGNRQVFLDQISAALANQFSMIPNLIGTAQVVSAKLPFVCPACGSEALHAIPYQASAATSHAPPCPTCQTKMDFDGFWEEYLPHAR
jgi:hypothetical protein